MINNDSRQIYTIWKPLSYHVQNSILSLTIIKHEHVQNLLTPIKTTIHDTRRNHIDTRNKRHNYTQCVLQLVTGIFPPSARINPRISHIAGPRPDERNKNRECARRGDTEQKTNGRYKPARPCRSAASIAVISVYEAAALFLLLPGLPAVPFFFFSLRPGP